MDKLLQNNSTKRSKYLILLAIIIDHDLCLNSNVRLTDVFPLEFVKALLSSFLSVYNKKWMGILMLWQQFLMLFQLNNFLLIIFHHSAGQVIKWGYEGC